MPDQYIHLATAREVLAYLENQQKPLETLFENAQLPQYYLGTTAPDAIHAYANAKRDRKIISHFMISEEEVHLSDNRGNREQALSLIREAPDGIFSVGYGVHLLADQLWAMTVYDDFCVSYDNDAAPREESGAAYYGDMSASSHTVYRNDSNVSEIAAHLRDARGVMMTARPPCFSKEYIGDGLASPEEQERWRDRTIGWFDAYKQTREPRYITPRIVAQFIRDAASSIGETISQLRG